MEKVLSFLLQNWKELSVLLVAILTFMVSLLRKKGKVDPVLEYIYAKVPEVIISVEKEVGSGKGSEKKELVMEILCSAYKKFTGYDLKESNYNLISRYVELVLSTPQKKEDKSCL